LPPESRRFNQSDLQAAILKVPRSLVVMALIRFF
jgi:hypothetical protein